MYRGWTKTDYQNKAQQNKQKWLQNVQKRTQTDYKNKHNNINKSGYNM